MKALRRKGFAAHNCQSLCLCRYRRWPKTQKMLAGQNSFAGACRAPERYMPELNLIQSLKRARKAKLPASLEARWTPPVIYIPAEEYRSGRDS